MMMTSASPPPSTKPQGCLPRVVALLSAVYLAGILFYFACRLLLGDGIWWIAFLNSFAPYTFAPLYILLPAAVLLRLWRDTARLMVLGLVGVLWFGPFFQARGPVKPSGRPSVDVVTLNMQAKRGDDLDEMITWLVNSNADLIFLQESVMDALPALQETHPYQIYHDGQLLLSRYALEQEPIEPFDDSRFVIEVEGQTIAVYNIHFDYPILDEARYPIIDGLPILGEITRYDETVRNQQIETLLENLENDPLPKIVAGDFNLSQHSIIYSTLTLELTDAFRETNSGLGATWPADIFPLLRLDYVWYSENLRALSSDIGPYIGSDHLPLEVTLELPPVLASPDAASPDAPETEAAPTAEVTPETTAESEQS